MVADGEEFYLGHPDGARARAFAWSSSCTPRRCRPARAPPPRLRSSERAPLCCRPPRRRPAATATAAARAIKHSSPPPLRRAAAGWAPQRSRRHRNTTSSIRRLATAARAARRHWHMRRTRIRWSESVRPHGAREAAWAHTAARAASGGGATSAVRSKFAMASRLAAAGSGGEPASDKKAHPADSALRQEEEVLRQ